MANAWFYIAHGKLLIHKKYVEEIKKGGRCFCKLLEQAASCFHSISSEIWTLLDTTFICNLQRKYCTQKDRSRKLS